MDRYSFQLVMSQMPGNGSDDPAVPGLDDPVVPVLGDLVALMLGDPVGLVAVGLVGPVVGPVVGKVVRLGLTVALELPATNCGVPPLVDEVALNTTIVPTATRTRDVVEMAIRVRTVRFLPRIRAAVGPAVCAMCAVWSSASASAASKSFDMARSPVGWMGIGWTNAVNEDFQGCPRIRTDEAPRPCDHGPGAP